MKHLLWPGWLLLPCWLCAQPVVSPQASGTTASLRGLSAVNDRIAWSSGSGGTVLRTLDGGRTWQNVSPAGADTLDFRDVQAFSADEALIMHAGYPGLILRTHDGGRHWQPVYLNPRPGIFLDALAFWDERHGLAFGDALDGRIVVITTTDGGRSWQRQRGPAALTQEGGYAASGTCVATWGDSLAWIALGTPAARVLCTSNRSQHWQGGPTPMQQNEAGCGIFSLAFSTAQYGIAVGGCYTHPEATTKNLAITRDGGRTWQLVAKQVPRGYRSAVAWLPGTTTWLCTGPSGTDISYDNGLSWQALDSIGYHALALPTKAGGWLCGPRGRLARVDFKE